MCDIPDEPIAPDELIFRRVPKTHYDSIAQESMIPLPDAAMRPNKRDTTGMSFYREKYRAPESLGREGNPFYVAVFLAKVFTEWGIVLNLTPGRGGPGHVELSEVTYDTRNTDRAMEVRNLLTKKICTEVLGPFVTPVPPPSTITLVE